MAQAIESVLSQSRPASQILVVDDGSTDDSLDLIRQYKDQITILTQPNSGMMEAANQAFNMCTGECAIFLDADDYLHPDAIQTIESVWKPGLSKIQWRMDKVDIHGKSIGSVPVESKRLPYGEVWKTIVDGGDFISPPTSGNAFSMTALSQLLPFRDERVGNSGTYFDRLPLDAYLKRKVPFLGDVISLDQKLSAYRVHGNNAGIGKSPYRHPLKRHRILLLSQLDIRFISNLASTMGFAFDERVLFKKNKHIILRILSFRIDSHPPFKNESVATLLDLVYFAFRSGNKSLKSRVRHLIIQMALLVTPAMLLRRRFHVK